MENKLFIFFNIKILNNIVQILNKYQKKFNFNNYNI